MISVCFRGKPFNITVTQVYGLTSNTEEAEVEWFYEGLQDLLKLTPKFYFIFKLYIIVLVLPNIKMNPPQVYMKVKIYITKRIVKSFEKSRW